MSVSIRRVPPADQRLVQAPHGREATLGWSPHEQAVGADRILDGSTLSKELRVGDHVDAIAKLRPLSLEDLAKALCSASGNRGFLDHCDRCGEVLGHSAGSAFDRHEIRFPRGFRRCADADEHHVGARHAIRRVHREAQASLCDLRVQEPL